MTARGVTRRRFLAASRTLAAGTTLAAGGVMLTPEAPRASSAEPPIALRRGINLWPWFALTREYPAPRTDYGWPPFQASRAVPTRADLGRLRQAGFDFVRLPVDPGPFLAFDGPRRDALLAELDAAIRSILAAGLRLVLNVQASAATHHFNPANLYGGTAAPLLPAYRAFVVTLARMLARRPAEAVALEPVNEPPQGCAAAAWAAVQRDLLGAARTAAPRLVLVATGGCGSMVSGLTALDPVPLEAFRPLLYTFHFYEPYLFTHQGAPWMTEPVYRALNAVPWPASAGSLDTTLAAVRRRMDAQPARPAAERAAVDRLTEVKLTEYFAAQPDRPFIDRSLAAVRNWCRRNGVPPQAVLMGEFGALRSDDRYVAAAAADRARYVADVRRSAESFGFPWAFWNLFDGMGLVRDDVSRAFDPALLTALGLRLPPGG